MRTIKFRQWIGKRFIYWGVDIDGISFASPCCVNGTYPPSEQFTGFTDSEGVEIYEGDVVEIGEGWKETVMDIRNFMSTYQTYVNVGGKKIKVIGNIHEPKEVL